MTGYDETDTDLQYDPANWAEHAACAGVNTDLFFPEQGCNANQAKQVCNTCPVRQPCLVYAVDNYIHHGVFGGLTAKERKAKGGTRPQLRLVPTTVNPRPHTWRPIDHGTLSGYQAHRRRGDQPCTECWQANSDHGIAYRARNRDDAS